MQEEKRIHIEMYKKDKQRLKKRIQKEEQRLITNAKRLQDKKQKRKFKLQQQREEEEKKAHFIPEANGRRTKDERTPWAGDAITNGNAEQIT